MKKLFTLIAVAFMAMGANAAEVELTLTEGHTLLISTLEAEGATDNDIVRFYIENTKYDPTAVATGDDGEYNPTSREGWGIGGFANSDNWSPTEAWTGQAGASWVYEYTVAQIKAVAGDTPGQYHGIGITINIYNDCKVAKVTVETAVVKTSTALWEGECNFGNWAEGQGVNVTADKFANANEGDAIEYIYTTTENKNQNWYQFKTIFSGTEDVLTSVPDLNDYGCATVALGSTNFKFTLNAADITRLKETGMYVNGKDIILTQVNLISTAGVAAVKTAAQQNGIRYNLAGQKVNESYKGVVIMNGKKMVQK